MAGQPGREPIQLSLQQWKHTVRNDDLTCYWTSDGAACPNSDNGRLPSWVLDELQNSAQHSNGDKRPKYNFDDKVYLQNGQDDGSRVEARANIVRCNAGEMFSGTFRILGRSKPLGSSDFHPESWPDDFSEFLIEPKVHSRFLFDLLFPPILPKESGSTEKPAQLVTGNSFANREVPHGAVIIAGSTGCGKSVFAQSLVYEVLRHHISAMSNTSRFPHAVTYEDPIENWELPERKREKGEAKAPTLNFMNPSVSERFGLCLTARQKPKDVGSIVSALMDARRQTPCCVYVGELRRPKEWRAVMEFAGSGHLVVITTHAASVNEAMTKVLAGCNARTPSTRRQWAGFIRGIVHLEMPSVDVPRKSEKVVLPSVWRGIGSARNALVSSGLSSVVPNSQYHDSRLTYFSKLIEKYSSANEVPRISPDIRAIIQAKARDLDTKDLTQ